MIYRSKAPLRIGLAGGGTDVSPYSDLYGGAILNATISMYSYATIEPLENGKIEFVSIDQQQSLIVDATDYLTIDGTLDLLKGVYGFGVVQYDGRGHFGRFRRMVEAALGRI